MAHLEFHHSLDQRHGATSRYVDQSALSSRVHPFEKRTTFATIASKDHGIAIAKIPATPGCPGRRTGWCSCCCHGPRFVGPDWERNDAPERSKRRQTELGPGHADFDSPGVVRRPRHRNASGSLAIALYTLPIRRCHCRGTEHRSDSVFVWGQWRWQPIHRSVRGILNDGPRQPWIDRLARTCCVFLPDDRSNSLSSRDPSDCDGNLAKIRRHAEWFPRRTSWQLPGHHCGKDRIGYQAQVTVECSRSCRSVGIRSDARAGSGICLLYTSRCV